MNWTSLGCKEESYVLWKHRAHTVTDQPALSAPACRTTEGRTEHKQHIKEPEEKTVSHASASLCHHFLKQTEYGESVCSKGTIPWCLFSFFPSLLSWSPMLVCMQNSSHAGPPPYPVCPISNLVLSFLQWLLTPGLPSLSLFEKTT